MAHGGASCGELEDDCGGMREWREPCHSFGAAATRGASRDTICRALILLKEKGVFRFAICFACFAQMAAAVRASVAPTYRSRRRCFGHRKTDRAGDVWLRMCAGAVSSSPLWPSFNRPIYLIIVLFLRKTKRTAGRQASRKCANNGA